jgi:iron complex transport system substrate-binding protein
LLLIPPLAVAATSAPGPVRIVSLAPNLTEMVYAIGAGSLLVGAVDYSDYPAEARKLPRVGDAYRVDFERLLALRPTIVLAWQSGTPREVVDRITSLGLRTEVITTQRLDDVPAALRRMGTLAGTRSTAETVAGDFERELRALRARHAAARPISVFLEIDDEPLYTVNGRHVLSEITAVCGGRNVFADLPQLAPAISLEAVIARDPQVILVTDATIGDPRALWSRWSSLRAVRDGNIYALPPDETTRATPRLIAGIRATCRALDEARRRAP